MSLPSEPYSRIERYLAKIAGQDVDIPDKPITRIECYLDYIVNNGGGVPASNAGAHNATFRGKALGTSFTANQADAIAAGTFDDIFVGDYWTIDGVNYRVAGLDTYLNYGNSPKLTVHHAVMVPDTVLATAFVLTEEETLANGYEGCYIRSSILPGLLSGLETSFGGNLLTFSTSVSSAVTGTSPSQWNWVSTKLELLSEGQLLGRGAWGNITRNAYNIGEHYAQLPLFALNPQYILSDSGYWLQDIWSSTSLSVIEVTGRANALNGTSIRGIRPYFLIGKSL